MILVDRLISERVQSGSLKIANFEPACVQPASYDLRVGARVHAPSQPEKPIDLAGNGGAFRLPPYGVAVVESHEDLSLPIDLIGRIGLKSSYARTGIFASVGPQIDPGFDGKLFVSLFNLTAGSHVIRYMEPFLTIEFHTLDEKPSHGYSGPYQGKYSIGPEVLDSLVKMEGVTLTQMQGYFSDFVSHINEMRSLMERFDNFIKIMGEFTTTIQDALLGGSSGVATAAQRSMRPMSVKRAAEAILELFRHSGTLYYSDIAERLNISLQTVIQACEMLQEQGKIQEADNGSARPQGSRNRVSSKSRRRSRS
jgi:dCTP deaminase